jgi:hypothetical protein
MTGLGTRPLKPGEVGSMRESTRERDVFRTLYADMDRVGTIACIPGERPRPPTRERIIVNGPIKSRGTAATQRQLDCFKAAIARSGVALDEAFVPALAPGWLDHFIYNEHYGTDEEFVYALADAMRDKYRAIVEAGFILQIDDPGIATSWDMLKPEPSLADYRKYVTLRIEALNHALAGIQPEKVRYHWCWGSWHGAHVNDIPLEHIIDIALKVKAQTYSFEAANVRHQHEMEVWKETKLAPGTILMPGVISHATNIVEHPELIARRLVDWAGIVGRENVVGGADCGMGGRVHPKLAGRSSQRLPKGRLSRRKPCGIDGQPFCKRHGFPPWQPSARQQGTASTQPGQTVSARVEGTREHASGGPARLLGFRRWRARSGGQHGRWRRAADRGDRAGKARVWRHGIRRRRAL